MGEYVGLVYETVTASGSNIKVKQMVPADKIVLSSFSDGTKAAQGVGDKDTPNKVKDWATFNTLTDAFNWLNIPA